MIDDALVVCILSTYLLRTVDNAARTRTYIPLLFNPFRTTVPFGGQTTRNLTGLPPKRDCSSKGVKREKLLLQSLTI